MRLAALLGLLALAGTAAADRALVVGISVYANPGPRGGRGSANDADQMADYYSKRGYTVDKLVGRQTTKSNILNALSALTKADRQEKVEVFFAGTGVKVGDDERPEYAIMPFDYVDGSREKALTIREIGDRIQAIKTDAPIRVTLDTCYSNALSRNARDADGLYARGYSPPGSRAADRLPTDDGMGFLGLTSEDQRHACYFIASKGSEEALEMGVGENAHGLFTRAFLQASDDPKNVTYGDICAAVQTSIAQTLEGRGGSRHQTPCVSDEFRDLPLGGRPGDSASVRQPPKDAWDVIARERPNAGQIRLAVEPEQANLLLGQAMKLNVEVEADGYLVVVWSQDKIELQIPEKDVRNNYLVAKVKKDDRFTMLDGDLALTNPGGNRITAILFKGRSRAQKFVDAVSTSQSVKSLQEKGMVSLEKESDEYATASLSFDVGDALFGGYQVTEGHVDELEKALRSTLYRNALADALDVEEWFQNLAQEKKPRRRASIVTVMLNVMIEHASKAGRTFVGPDSEGLDEKAQALVAGKAEAMKGVTDPVERRKLNAQLLAALFPGLVTPIPSP